MKWTTEKLCQLMRDYPDHPNKVIAEKLGCTESAVQNMAIKQGLKKSDQYMASVPGGFPKGNQPWNAGKKGWQAGGRARETQFKKGQKPATEVPVGSLYVNKDGHVEKKVSDASGKRSARWRSVNELVWVEEHGPIPKDHVIRFKSGMKTTNPDEITVDKLECISRAENMKRNSYHRYPQPIPRLIQMRGVLNRQINRREKA